MKPHYFLLFLFLILIACTKPQPKGVLEHSQMVQVMYEYQLNHALRIETGESVLENKEAYWKYIYEKYGIREADFDSSMVWYTRHNEQLNEVYKDVYKRLQGELQTLERKGGKRIAEQKELSGDSIDIWQEGELLLFPMVGTEKYRFSIVADTTYHALDTFVLEGNIHLLGKKKIAMNAVLGLQLTFQNDSIQGKTLHLTGEGRFSLPLITTQDSPLRMLHGFLYFPNPQDQTQVLLHKVKLMRYHSKQSSLQNEINAESSVEENEHIATMEEPLEVSR
ncbi:MAG: DUF4296 domain-containing protein [Phocaeicola sp.]|nr:DUF4296 domain-containing protein [Phocaeicola sp.]MDD7448753.1 DUF4296 domain-containing protein [Prevotellaceae bacterium]MDY5939722.1 DUF4296 domain-containing protein [Phocaeicola sp.]